MISDCLTLPVGANCFSLAPFWFLFRWLSLLGSRDRHQDVEGGGLVSENGSVEGAGCGDGHREGDEEGLGSGDGHWEGEMGGLESGDGHWEGEGGGLGSGDGHWDWEGGGLNSGDKAGLFSGGLGIMETLVAMVKCWKRGS